MQLLIAPARFPRGELAQPRARLGVAARGASGTASASGSEADEPTRAPRARRKGGDEMGDDLPPLLGGHHFRPTTSLSIALSSERSATSFFSRRFSSSRARNRLASDTWSPSYFARQR